MRKALSLLLSMLIVFFLVSCSSDETKNNIEHDTKDKVTELNQISSNDLDDLANLEVSYIGNMNSKKFHYLGCDSVKKMKESNKYYHTGTRDEIIAKGYEPCANCNP